MGTHVKSSELNRAIGHSQIEKQILKLSHDPKDLWGGLDS